MENQVYRLDGSKSSKIEFSIAHTNELNPDREARVLAVTVLGKSIQYDYDLEQPELDSLMRYLTDANRYVQKFNEDSDKEAFQVKNLDEESLNELKANVISEFMNEMKENHGINIPDKVFEAYLQA